MTQQELADELGVARSAVSLWENDLRPVKRPIEKLIAVIQKRQPVKKKRRAA